MAVPLRESFGLELSGRNQDFGILRLSLGANLHSHGYRENADQTFTSVLQNLSELLKQPIARNFQTIPDMRIFVGNHLYLIKPMQRRFWLESSALADAPHCLILPACIEALGDNPQEDDITLNLVSRFHLDAVVRRLFHHWEFHFEPQGQGADGAYFSKGQIDLAVFWDLNREHYLAYEAKRLNVMTQSGTASLATPYVKEGVLRFVTEQYSEGLPLGCMLGYVINGNLDGLTKKLEKALSDNQTLVSLISGPSALSAMGSAQRFETDHIRQNNGGRINIRHALVPCC